MTNSKRWQVGDILMGSMHNQGIERKILEVRNTGYKWYYLDIPDKSFQSENSSDPFLEIGWKIQQ